MRGSLSAAALALGLLFGSGTASALQHEGHDHGSAAHDHGSAAPAAHGEAAHGEAAHGDEHADGHHVPTFDDFNWYYGLISEQEGVEPSLLFRPKGMPVPFAALLLNTALLYWLLYRMLGGSIRAGLKKRKEDILRGMEEAAKMKREAEAQLAAYESKLASIDEEVARIRAEAKQTAEAEGARLLREAKERRERMERDAHLLVEQELKAVKVRLTDEIIASAVQSATASLKAKLGEADQQRFGEEYLSGIRQSAGAIRGPV